MPKPKDSPKTAYGCLVIVSSNSILEHLIVNYIPGTSDCKMYNCGDKTTVKTKQYSGKNYNKCNQKLKRPEHIKVI